MMRFNLDGLSKRELTRVAANLFGIGPPTFDRHTIPNGAWMQWWSLRKPSNHYDGWTYGASTRHPDHWTVYTDHLSDEAQAAAFLALEDFLADPIVERYVLDRMPEILMNEFMGPPPWMEEP